MVLLSSTYTSLSQEPICNLEVFPNNMGPFVFVFGWECVTFVDPNQSDLMHKSSSFIPLDMHINGCVFN